VTGKGIKECNGRKSSSELTRDKSMSTREREENIQGRADRQNKGERMSPRCYWTLTNMFLACLGFGKRVFGTLDPIT
jgi:hypothetical protein